MLAAARLQKIGGDSVGEPLVGTVVGEGVAVETRQAFRSTEPQEAARISNNTVDGVLGQAVSDGVTLDGQSLGSYEKLTRQHNRSDGKNLMGTNRLSVAATSERVQVVRARLIKQGRLECECLSKTSCSLLFSISSSNAHSRAARSVGRVRKRRPACRASGGPRTRLRPSL